MSKLTPALAAELNPGQDVGAIQALNVAGRGLHKASSAY